MNDLSIHGKPVIVFSEECERGAIRPVNRDSVLHVRVALGDLMIVSDGSGGYTEEAVSSRMAVEYIYAHLSALPVGSPAETAIREAVASANKAILEATRMPASPKARIGTTVLIALLQQEGDLTQAWIGNIGNSRAYLLRVGRMNCLTVDHSRIHSLLSLGLITPEEAPTHPEATALTRGLGRQANVEIDIEQHPLSIGDTLLLCTDGLWGCVPEQEIEKAASGPSVETAARNLLEMAYATGGRDNIGIEMARLVPPPDPVAPPKDHTLAIAVIVLAFLVALGCLCVLAWYYF